MHTRAQSIQPISVIPVHTHTHTQSISVVHYILARAQIAHTRSLGSWYPCTSAAHETMPALYLHMRTFTPAQAPAPTHAAKAVARGCPPVVPIARLTGSSGLSPSSATPAGRAARACQRQRCRRQTGSSHQSPTMSSAAHAGSPATGATSGSSAPCAVPGRSRLSNTPVSRERYSNWAPGAVQVVVYSTWGRGWVCTTLL